MALEETAVKELIRKLDADREAYLETLNRAHAVLTQALTGVGAAVPASTSAASYRLPDLQSLTDRPLAPLLPLRSPAGGVESLKKTSITFSNDDDDSDTDHDESFFVQTPLAPESFEEADLARHLLNHPWDAFGRKILEDVPEDPRIAEVSREAPDVSLFPLSDDQAKDRSDLAHGEVFDVGSDGAPLPFRSTITGRTGAKPVSRALEIWSCLNNTNADPAKLRKAVGRIIILREPSPLLFGALHCTMSPHFDMDQIFKLLSDDTPTTAHMFHAFAPEPCKQRTFIFSFKYFTIISEGCKPKSWQQSDEERSPSSTHIPITRCSSIVALHLSGDAIASVKNRARRRVTEKGYVYDPFASWRVLSIQCFPDWNSTMDCHDSSKSYVNGPEAFMVSLKAEFRDARKRFREINERIVRLATPPSDFMFNPKIRDELLFEDDTYTYSRRYFWCYQTLAIMNDSIQAMIRAYTETFTDQVWAGEHKTLWPGTEDSSPRAAFWRRRMNNLKKDLDREIRELEKLFRRNIVEQKEIEALRDHLFSGTSVQESRNSVEQAQITVQQGNNIKLLTLITIFFLPLTYVTSIFGMTALPQDGDFVSFGIVTVVICLPTYLFVGSMNTDRGVKFWRDKTSAFIGWLHRLFTLAHLRKGETNSNDSDQDFSDEPSKTAEIKATMNVKDLSSSKNNNISHHLHGSSTTGAENTPRTNPANMKFMAITDPLAAHFNPSTRNARMRHARSSFPELSPISSSQTHPPPLNVDEHYDNGNSHGNGDDGDTETAGRPSIGGGSSLFRSFSDKIEKMQFFGGMSGGGRTLRPGRDGKMRRGRRGLSFGEDDVELG